MVGTAVTTIIQGSSHLICGRVPLSPNNVFNPTKLPGISGDKYVSYKQCNQRSILMAVTAAGAGKGGGLLEKPTIERNTPGRESEFDLRYSHYTLYSNCTNF
ncbi:hypothetical protein RGQ29_021121 [Quercus rubra]|uniref:Uncharacterized protein n=1 Tax=Quercus rubra TaxID=3512 RepID=A0AAN7FCV6_QUERU|nr:hypothetical protein RGQ29_021121 [Quercus rubra]